MIELSRRELFRYLALGAATAPLVPALAHAAKNECSAASDIPKSEKQVRKALKYTDNSPKADKQCADCELFEAAGSAEACGGCKTVPGPIHPKGHCTAWVAKSS